MAKTRQQKTEALKRIEGVLKDAKAVVFVNFHGLGVADTNDMRRALKDQEVGYLVTKKTLTKRALQSSGVEGNIPELQGELAVAWGEDAIAPARGVYEFAKKHKDKLAILGGIFERRFMDAAEMTTIASIPPLQTLRGMFVNVINSPIQGLAVALDQIAQARGKV
ncbi:50S ribosomal protein L10 [Candidatus Kaiserbacteria bacterium RIFCSPHIGHO2_02_FULL_49_11]|uniref:Large ribosomal subunit protein uL10 n=1 Tax=Candidatus Kaiserbacteria bacterium RIFCSPHIGHO2_02_FULL_49_11 TaxID=1798489 RepID=A0A1F6D105_9BACT|nr:MAG: 50S ribosomal protein L10 [Candidatus Kaiserbacteria bacterium RIFCSPHIGHO2_02_FULL_49_11]